MKERRTKQQIYSDILYVISNSTDNDLKLTSIQLSSKLAYNKVKDHITYLEKYGLVESKSGYRITSKGRLFLENSVSIQNNMEILYKEYLSEKSDLEENEGNIKLYEKTQMYSNDKPVAIVNVQKSHVVKEFIQIQNVMNAVIIELENRI